MPVAQEHEGHGAVRMEAAVRQWPEGGGRLPGLAAMPGVVDYEAAWALQLELARDRREGRLPDLLLLVEHPPTFTIGRGGDEAHLLASAEELAALGARVHHVDRGGDITYHGPGQIVGYPIIDLWARGRDIHRYLRVLEEAIIRTLAELGVAAGRLPPHTGVWVGEEKVAAIGVKLTRGVALHGFALNVQPDMRYFAAIVPCGIRDKGVTSLAALLGRPVDLAPARARLTEHLGELLGIVWRPVAGAESSPEGLRARLLAAAGSMP